MLREKKEYGIVFAVVAVVVVIIVALSFLGGEESRKEISIEEATFTNDSLASGDNTVLKVRVKNKSSTDLANKVMVWLEPSAKASISVGEKWVEVGSMGSKSLRVVNFSIGVKEGALEGKYEIVVHTSAESPFEGDKKQVFLDVGESS